MRLTRRDALYALCLAGSGASGCVDGIDNDDGALDSSAVETLLALAAVLYPAEVEATEEFVETYVLGRATDEDHLESIAESVESLSAVSSDFRGESFASLSPTERETLLEEVGLRETASDPRGTERERIRYFLVNELLYALYTTPTGGELLGVENPIGHPGGLASYQRGPR